MNVIKRISRFGNDPVLNKDGKPVVAEMNERQVRLLHFLGRHRYATFEDIRAYLGGDPTALHRTIRVLKARNNGCIKVCDQDVAEYNLRRKVRYELDKRGIEYLRNNGSPIADRKYARNFDHAALASHATAQIEAGVAVAGNARLISWSEILNSQSMPAATKKLDHPAALPASYHVDGEVFDKIVYADSRPFGIELSAEHRKFRFFPGVEADTGSEPIATSDFHRTSIFAKFMAYLAIEQDETYKSHFGFPTFLVPFLTTSPIRMKSMMAELERITNGRGSKTIMFAVARPAAPAGYLFTEPWQRVGHSPISLSL